MLDLLTQICAPVGLFVLIYQVYKILSVLWLFARPSSLPRYLHGQPGGSNAWACVSGASDGIGFAFSQELAARGFNVILHGRNEVKLNRCKALLESHYPTRSFQIVVIDTSDPEAVAKVERFAATLKRDHTLLTVLINNVGGAGGMKAWTALADRTPAEVDALLDMNARFPAQLTRALLPILCANRPSLVLNIGSVSGIVPSPYLTVYSGAKAFDLAWSRSLRVEMRAEGFGTVEVLGVTVGPVGDVPGQGGAIQGFRVFTPTNRKMARAALDRVGCPRHTVTAYWAHALMTGVLEALPGWLLERIVMRVGRQERANDGKKRS